MEQESKGIRWQSEHRGKVQNLMCLVNEETLREEHRKQSRQKATGVDGVSKDDYAANLDENLTDLSTRLTFLLTSYTMTLTLTNNTSEC